MLLSRRKPVTTNSSTLSFRRLVLTAAALFLVGALVSGCGSRAGNNTLSGTVTVGGKPAAGAVMTLHYADGKTHQVTISDKGIFTAGAVPVGKATVTFSSMAQGMVDPTGRNKDKMLEMMKGFAPTALQVGAAQMVPIPAKYTSKDTSDLTWEITSGKNQKTFELRE
jgi:hypothetical protein